MLNAIFRGPSGIRSGWRLLIFIALAAIPFITIQVLLAVAGFRPDLAHNLPPTVILVGESVEFLCPLFAAWVMSRMERKTFRNYGLPARGAFGHDFWVGAGLGIIALSALMLGIWLGHGFYFGNLALSTGGIFYFGVMWAVAFLVVGFAEEFLFRGYALATLSDGIGFWPAAIVLSVFFGAIHLSNLGENPTGALSAGLVGLLFCFSLRRTGSLWFAIGLHATWDYGESFIFSVPNSGTRVEGYLLNSHFQSGASAWLTGGSVGPEGSIFVFVVLVILFVIVDRMYPEVRFPVRSTAELNPPQEAGAVFREPENAPEGD
ncbi:MAG TPA: CPBP family intramembrane glutamic endopeptidase [Terriglobia bacterium]|nr:CPBP family intramembrane glutamic endopeptidase [Terriglobia bacterium]